MQPLPSIVAMSRAPAHYAGWGCLPSRHVCRASGATDLDSDLLQRPHSLPHVRHIDPVVVERLLRVDMRLEGHVARVAILGQPAQDTVGIDDAVRNRGVADEAIFAVAHRATLLVTGTGHWIIETATLEMDVTDV